MKPIQGIPHYILLCDPEQEYKCFIIKVWFQIGRQ